jgi:hypothetical protein
MGKLARQHTSLTRPPGPPALPRSTWTKREARCIIYPRAQDRLQALSSILWLDHGLYGQAV